MRFLGIFLLLWLTWGLGSFSHAVAQVSVNDSSLAQPEVSTWLVAQGLQPNNAETYTLQIAVVIPPNHHGYLDTGEEGLFIPLTFGFTSLEEQGAHIVMQSHPTGEQDEIVHATVLRGSGEFTFRIEATQTTSLPVETLSLTFRYQICNDMTKLCYPPQELTVPLHSVPLERSRSPISVTAVRQSPTSLTLNEHLTTLFRSHTDNLFLTFGVVIVAGLLASVTPCVYPMLPITAAIFAARGEGSRRRSQLHAIIYFIGIICFYTLLALIAATTGTAISVITQD
jgi:thiol:disulfide interchange protein